MALPRDHRVNFKLDLMVYYGVIKA